tara:strand:- start:11 stop:112 length:102 start_codon:yes stop_codon:yes gene_type:complete
MGYPRKGDTIVELAEGWYMWFGMDGKRFAVVGV